MSKWVDSEIISSASPTTSCGVLTPSPSHLPTPVIVDSLLSDGCPSSVSSSLSECSADSLTEMDSSVNKNFDSEEVLPTETTVIDKYAAIAGEMHTQQIAVAGGQAAVAGGQAAVAGGQAAVPIGQVAVAGETHTQPALHVAGGQVAVPIGQAAVAGEMHSQPALHVAGESAPHVYKMVFDNIDKNIKPRDMRADAQTISLHYVQIYSVRSRINFSSLSTTPKCAHGEVNMFDILPSEDDYKQLQHNFAVHVARILTDHLTFFKHDFKGIVPKHLLHQYSEEMSNKSDVVSHHG